MIPNGQEIIFDGHKVVFESTTYQCRGCFFENRDSCPDCDEGIWVEEGSPWHTEPPTEKGWYVCKMRGTDLYETEYFTGANWNEEIIEKWQKVEETD